jgi:hypothetical protein
MEHIRASITPELARAHETFADRQVKRTAAEATRMHY